MTEQKTISTSTASTIAAKCSMSPSSHSTRRARRPPSAAAAASPTMFRYGIEERLGGGILRGECGPELRFHVAADLIALAFGHRMISEAQALQGFDGLLAVLDGLRALKCSGVGGGSEDRRLHACRQLVPAALADYRHHRRKQVLREPAMLGDLIELGREHRRGIVLEAIDHAGLQRGIDLVERDRGGNRAEQLERIDKGGGRQYAQLHAFHFGEIVHRILGIDAARAEVRSPREHGALGPLLEDLRKPLAHTAVERFEDMRVAVEQIA